MRVPNPIHPGRMLLEEFLAPAAISQRAFARQLGWTVARLNELIGSDN
jgi:plasmid maintenance system antidote protein VapI